MRPLADRQAIESRLDAVEWFVEHGNDSEIEPLKKLLKSLLDLEKQLIAVLNGRSKPKEFHRLCQSWEQSKVLCAQLRSHFQQNFPSAITLLMDTIVQSLEIVTSYTLQLNDVAIHSGDKTKLFNRIEDYPEMGILIEKIHDVEKKLQVNCFVHNYYFY